MNTTTKSESAWEFCRTLRPSSVATGGLGFCGRLFLKGSNNGIPYFPTTSRRIAVTH